MSQNRCFLFRFKRLQNQSKRAQRRSQDCLGSSGAGIQVAQVPSGGVRGGKPPQIIYHMKLDGCYIIIISEMESDTLMAGGLANLNRNE